MECKERCPCGDCRAELFGHPARACVRGAAYPFGVVAVAKEHESPFGAFYSEWAYDVDAQQKAEQNRRVFERYEKRFAIACGSADDIAEICKHSAGKMVFCELPQSYTERHFRICQNPARLSVAECALIVDRGNLCFGFNYGLDRIDIYTD